jgi:hypothetical protein
VFPRQDTDVWLGLLTSAAFAAAAVLPPAPITAPAIRLTPPTEMPSPTVPPPGAHTSDALLELGVSATRLAALLDDHVIHQPIPPAQGVPSP